MCASKEPKSEFEDIQELKNKIKILSKKLYQSNLNSEIG